ncbi:hypothetical protein DNTS_021097, partial [Danionella cerebrum]
MLLLIGVLAGMRLHGITRECLMDQYIPLSGAYLDKPVLTVHQTVGDVRGNYYQEKTVFLRCTVNSNPPARFIWKRGNRIIEQSKDNGVDIYEPLYTQGETKVLKLKNLRPQDFANYTCQVSVRNVCDIPDTSVTFRLTNTT